MKSGNRNFLEPSGPLQACNGTALPFSDTGCRGRLIVYCIVKTVYTCNRCDFNNSLNLILEFLPTVIAYKRHALKMHATKVKHTRRHTHTHFLYIIEYIIQKKKKTKFSKVTSLLTYDGKVS